MKRVLIVEDEALIALDLEGVLSEAGYESIGVAGTVQKALDLLQESMPDFAVLDANLHGESAAPVAEALIGRGIPFLGLSGYGRDQMPAPFAGSPLLSKPFARKDLISKIEGLCTVPG
jgi:DNA-binding response OmpR family regulator